MKKYFLCFLTILITISFSACSLGDSKETLKWNMYESQVRKIGKIPKENQTVKIDEHFWINCNDQEILGCVGEITYYFNNSKLTDINFTPNQINNVDKMNKIYGTLKESVSLEYGNPTIDEVRESKNSDLQYHYTEWNIENTLIMLQDNEKELHISLGFHSTEYLKSFEETQTTEAFADEETKIKRKVYSYVAEYMDTTVNDVKVNEDFGTEADGDYVVLVYLTWDLKNNGEMSKKMLDLYSSDMAAQMYNDLPSVQELSVFWTVPYLNDGQAKISFERKSNGMVYTDTMFDYNFD